MPHNAKVKLVKHSKKLLLVLCLYVWYTLHRNGFAAHKKLGCSFLAHSKSFWGGDF